MTPPMHKQGNPVDVTVIYHVLVYISSVLTYLVGDCAMYFDHGVHVF